LAAAPPAAAELVVLTDGAFLKVDAYRVEGQSAVLELSASGTVTLPLGRIERIVDDEIVPEPEIADLAEERAAAALSLLFRSGAEAPATPFGSEIRAAAERHGMWAELVAAMVRAESNFDPRAVSVKGARGLMQLMPATADRFGVRLYELFEPERNLEAGVRYLRWLHDRYAGDLSRILAAYNAGEANVDRYDGVPPFRETRGYIRRVYASLGLEPDPASAQ